MLMLGEEHTRGGQGATLGLVPATSSCYSAPIASSEEGLRTYAVTAMASEGSSIPLPSTTLRITHLDGDPS